MKFEYFTNENKERIYIQDRGGKSKRYAVYANDCCVCDQLNKKEALKLANKTLKEKSKR